MNLTGKWDGMRGEGRRIEPSSSEKPLAAGPLVVPGALQVSKANTLEKLPAPRNAHGAQ